jgi:hypothetical protein
MNPSRKEQGEKLIDLYAHSVADSVEDVVVVR